jgi:hypothetical protein
VGRGKEMRLSESLRISEVGSGQQGAMIGEGSCGLAYHVNEYDEKLETLMIQREDQRSILINGGIKTFLPSSQVEANAHDDSATEEKRQPIETVKEEEMDKTLMSILAEGEVHSAKFLKIFSQEAEQEMTATLEPTVKGEVENIDFAKLYEELEALERKVMVKILHIQ